MVGKQVEAAASEIRPNVLSHLIGVTNMDLLVMFLSFGGFLFSGII